MKKTVRWASRVEWVMPVEQAPIAQKEVSIFICSSSDVLEERDAAWEVINALQEELRSRVTLRLTCP